MTSEPHDPDADARARLARFAALGAPRGPREGGLPEGPAEERWARHGPWVPAAPGVSSRDGGPAGDAAGTRHGSLRERAMAAAVTGYTAAHGHPLEHPSRDGAPAAGPRRWAVRPATVVVALVVLAGVTGAVALRAQAPPSAVAVPVGEGRAAEGGRAADDGGADGGGGASGATGASPGPAAAGVGDAGPSDPTQVVVVHVVGQVAAPGVLELPVGARVTDALAAAGGALPTADLTAVNLARELVDGEQVVVPQPGQAVAPAPGPGGPGPAGAGPGPLDLNTADLAGLDALPGIGPVLAERIVAWREEHGRFSSVEELAEVPGIGPALLEDLRELVRV